MFKNNLYILHKKTNTLMHIKRINEKTNLNLFFKKFNKTFLYKKCVFIKNIRKLISGSKNVCSITGKYKRVFNSLKINRHIINKWANSSNLPNYVKSS